LSSVSPDISHSSPRSSWVAHTERTSDLTAVAIVFPKARFSEGATPIKKTVVIVQGFIPEIGFVEREEDGRYEARREHRSMPDLTGVQHKHVAMSMGKNCSF